VGKANIMSFNNKTSSIEKTATIVITSQDPKREGHDQGNQEERNTREKDKHKDKTNKQRGRKQRLYEDDLLRTKWSLKSSSHESLDSTKLSPNDKTPYNAYFIYMLNKPQVHLNRN
jgi:hypothetical protein